LTRQDSRLRQGLHRLFEKERVPASPRDQQSLERIESRLGSQERVEEHSGLLR
jgi:hypothetical protein